MAAIDTAYAPSFLTRLTSPLRKMQKSALRRRGPLDAALEDYLGETAQAGDKVLQLGASDGVAAAFLDRGVFHHLVAPAASAETVEAICQLRGCSASRLRVFSSITHSGSAGEVDTVWLSKTSSLAVLAAHFRHALSRLKTGGLLFVEGTDCEFGKTLYKQLGQDMAWRHDETIASEVAVFRRIA